MSNAEAQPLMNKICLKLHDIAIVVKYVKQIRPLFSQAEDIWKPGLQGD